MKIKKWNNFNEELKYVVGNNGSDEDIDVFSGDPKWSDDEITRSVVDGYIDQIERATGAKVTSVEGEANESDSKLYFELDDDNSINITYVYHPFSGKMTVDVLDVGTKSYGGKGVVKKDDKYNVPDDVYLMIKDIYAENGLDEPSHKIDLPKELFGNDPYFEYRSDEQTDQTTVYFESEKAAQD